jgi:hypothetical protein
MKVTLPAVVLVASFIVAAGCTGSEDATASGTGGMHGTGGAPNSGTGGGGSGTGGTIGGSGGVGGGTGGSITGSGGARSDGGSNAADGASDGGGDGGAADGPLSFEADIAYELFFSCGGCHLAPTIQGGFDMKIAKSDAPGPLAYPTVTGTVTAAHNGCSALDTTKKRIVAGKPANSLLYVKISMANPPGGCGGHMPMGANMTQRQIDKIRLWITQGAMP